MSAVSTTRATAATCLARHDDGSRMSIRIHASGKIERPLWWPRSRLLMVPAGLDLPGIFKVCEELERRSGEPLIGS